MHKQRAILFTVFSILLWVGSATVAEASDPGASLKSDLKAYWSLNESSGLPMDAAGSHHATGTGGNPTLGISGVFGSAADFDADEYYDVPDSDDWNLGSNDFSIALWVSLDPSASGERYFLGWNYDSSRNLWLAHPDGTSLHFNFATDAVGGHFGGISMAWVSNADQWYHVAVIRSGADLKAYIDGTQVGATYNIGTTAMWDGPTSTIHIGQAADYGNFVGQLDEIGIWHRAITEAELTYLQTHSVPGLLDSPAAPSAADSAMFTLEDIYDRLDTGAAGTKRTGAFTEPPSGLGITGHSLDGIMAKAPATNASAATALDVLTGKAYWGLSGEAWGQQTGAVPVGNDLNGTDGSLVITIRDGLYLGSKTATASDTDLVTGNIKNGASIFGVAGKTEVVDTSTGSAVAGEILETRKAWVDGAEVTGTMLRQALSAANDTVQAGVYQATTLSAVDADLATANIKSGVTIFGVQGSLYAPVPKTGQTTLYRTGDDGDLEPGVAWPSLGFTDHEDGTVTDNLTGLMWTKSANIWGSANWNTAIDNCNGYSLATYSDWRLPNRRELESLLDLGGYGNALRGGSPFTDLQGGYYWTSTTFKGNTDNAHAVDMNDTSTSMRDKTDTSPVWPVRGGQ